MQCKRKLSYIALGGVLLLVGLVIMSSISLAQAGPWTKKANMPTRRGGLSTSVVNGIIYAIGGGTDAFTALPTVEAYDSKTDAWTTKTNMLSPRFGLSTSVVNGIIYAIGAPGPDWGVVTTASTVEAYDPATNTWTTKANMPTPRATLSTSVVDGIIYAIGGTQDIQNGLPTVEAYDPKTDTWTTKTNMPTPRFMLSTCVVNGIIYAIGGTVTSTPADTLGRTVEAYDPVTNTWTTKAPMPTPRTSLSSNVVDGIIYAIGGTGLMGGTGISTVEAYNPVTNAWMKKTDMPTARKILASSAVNSKIYAIGGYSYGLQASSCLPTVQEYDPSSDRIGVGVASEATDVPLAYELSQNYPNPFNPATTIRFRIPVSGFATLKVHDVLGKEVATLVQELLRPGTYERTFDAQRLASGVYFYRMQAGSFVETKKLVLLK